ncbi:MAG: 30S ribosomal protein S16 [Chlamydiae bacterium]|nr:30S ribosomal protein S16 [Chlamydiota bacterium]
MAVKIRLRQQGRTNRKTYRLVAAEDRSPRDGKHLEILGWYNPHEEKADKRLSVNTEKIQYWLSVGAILTPKAKALVKEAAPNVIKELNERMQKAKEKQSLKRRQRRKKTKAPKAAAKPKKTPPAPKKEAKKPEVKKRARSTTRTKKEPKEKVKAKAK